MNERLFLFALLSSALMTSAFIRQARLDGELRAAARSGDLRLLARCAEQGGDFTAADHKGLTPLMMAVRGGPEALHFVLGRVDAAVEAPRLCQRRQSALCWAAMRGFVWAIDALAPFGDPTPSGEAPPLLVAARHGHERAARRLLELFPEARFARPGADNFLLCALRGDLSLETIREAVSACDPAQKGHDGADAFLLAMSERRLDVARLLLPRVDLAAVDRRGRDALARLANGPDGDDKLRAAIECVSLLCSLPVGQRPSESSVASAMQLALRREEWPLADALAAFAASADAGDALARFGAQRLPGLFARQERADLERDAATQQNKTSTPARASSKPRL
jgi:hypothetical protein